MYKDTDFVSRQPHELDYLLRRHGRVPDEAGRRHLLSLLAAFHADPAWAPHQRADFYRYLTRHLGPARPPSVAA